MLRLSQPDVIARRPFSPGPSDFGTAAAIRRLRWTDAKHWLAEWRRRAVANRLSRIAADIDASR